MRVSRANYSFASFSPLALNFLPPGFLRIHFQTKTASVLFSWFFGISHVIYKENLSNNQEFLEFATVSFILMT